ncbi:MAG: DUF2914 domain-containing protein [Gammaproteobacteria bacterium]|nr:DUF2914 domain-containing protein [Gammaproteobacteria bacterium]
MFIAGAAYSASKGSITRALFTTQVKDREPVNQVLMLTNVIKTISFFTDVRNMDGKTITHFWEYEGKPVSQKEFEIKGSRRRVYSELDLDSTMTGAWSVIVRDENGWPLKVVTFKYVDSTIATSQTMILSAGK